MNREESLRAIRSTPEWDVLVIGGGATGLGTAVDAASRGFRTVLLEQADFAQATSSRATKLIHGGVRYLRQGDIGLVRDALHERALLLRNAPHLIRPLGFVIPTYKWWESPFYATGLRIYDRLAGAEGIGATQRLSIPQTLERVPSVARRGLRGGVLYHDAQFDDARLAIALALTLHDLRGVPLNYARVTSLLKSDCRVSGVTARDLESGDKLTIKARVVVNATGVFADTVRALDDARAEPMLAPSQGAHIVLDRAFMPGRDAILVPRTDDGRVLFAIPWRGHAIVGTTDTPVREAVLEPRPLAAEIDYLLAHAGRMLFRPPKRDEVLSAFAGLRPLVRSARTRDTASLSRDHVIEVSASGLVTIAGGKWTTYRKMGEEAVDAAVKSAGLAAAPSRTQTLRIHGWVEKSDSVYGTDLPLMESFAGETAEWGDRLHLRLPYRPCEVLWGVRYEMARTLEDVLARRIRALFLDARAAMEIAPHVARLIAQELGRDEDWQRQQVEEFEKLARGYLPG